MWSALILVKFIELFLYAKALIVCFSEKYRRQKVQVSCDFRGDTESIP